MGQSGSYRAEALDTAGLSAMEAHGKRLDRTGDRRVVRNTKALIYDPYGHGLNLIKAHADHIKGARVNKGAKKVALHAFIQFPTDLEITPENEQMMLDQAVAFVNKTHGRKAVFHGRLDRDEKGRHGVDVFFAPTYDKTTSQGTERWVSLSKFGAALARDRLGQKAKEEKTDKKDPATGKAIWEPVFDENDNPVMVWQDSSFFVGRVMQDEWFEHLRDDVGLDWAKRGKQKVSRDPDRLEPEEYGLEQDRKALEVLREEVQQEVGAVKTQISEALAKRDAALAKAANHERLAEKHRLTAVENDQKAAKALKNAETHEKRKEDAQRTADSLIETIEGLRSTETRLTASVERLEARESDLRASVRREEAELETVSNAVAQKKTKNASLMQQMQTLSAA